MVGFPGSLRPVLAFRAKSCGRLLVRNVATGSAALASPAWGSVQGLPPVRAADAAAHRAAGGAEKCWRNARTRSVHVCRSWWVSISATAESVGTGAKTGYFLFFSFFSSPEKHRSTKILLELHLGGILATCAVTIL